MPILAARGTVRRALALAALGVGLEPLLVRLLGTRAPGWSHWLCSASATHRSSAATPALAQITSASGVGATLHTTLALLAVHWPHLLPIVLALATLVYLWREQTAWRAAEAAAARR